MKSIILASVLLVFYSITDPTTNLSKNYIDTYKELAVVEMHRSGIPASIILAQGLHESAYGKSPLAKKANNHFGIKCKNYWMGKRYYHKDDDTDDDGTLIESCFRKYENDMDSYIDHSNFLMDSPHYDQLFKFPSTDYISWAIGLKKAGYATDPEYAEKLVKIIEKNELYQYDFWPYPLKSKI
jgi:flagellum-specific peptidoglycan hydrolase FlgJ